MATGVPNSGAPDGVPSGGAFEPRTSRPGYGSGAGAADTALAGGRGLVRKGDGAHMATIRSMVVGEDGHPPVLDWATARDDGGERGAAAGMPSEESTKGR